MEILQSRKRVAEAGEHLMIRPESEGISQRALAHVLVAVRAFLDVSAGVSHPSARAGISVVEDDQSALIAMTIGVGINIFIHAAVIAEEVVKQEIADLGKKIAAMQQRRNFPLMAR